MSSAHPESEADPRDPDRVARELGISREAVALYRGSDVIDLHLDTFIWHRLFGYDPRRRHESTPLGRHFFGQVDFPRVREAGLTGATWVITTNPFRRSASRRRVFRENLRGIEAMLRSASDDVAIVRTAAEYRAARAEGKHGAFIGVQGGNALDFGPDALDEIPELGILRVTLVHLTSSSLGRSSVPLSGLFGSRGLSREGREYVEELERRRIFVDLAHIDRDAFFDVVEMHDPSRPLLATHTGVDGVRPHWRNLDDDQLRAIADSGGVVGVIFQQSFLGRRDVSSSAVVDHLAHIVETVGEDHAAIGSDFDGAISPPRDLRSPLELPRLVQHMLDRGWSDTRIRKILGGNFLRVVESLRG